MRKSKVETALTRQKIVAVAASVFRRQGLGASGIATVMGEAGMTQGGFYRHFESKDQLVEEAVSLACAELALTFNAWTAGKSAEAALQFVVKNFLHQLQTENSVAWCPLIVLNSELFHSTPVVRAAAAKGCAALVEWIALQLLRMRVENHQRVAQNVAAFMIGAVSLSRLMTEPAAVQAVLDNAELAVISLIGNAACREVERH